jgi:hypothetical protein
LILLFAPLDGGEFAVTLGDETEVAAKCYVTESLRLSMEVLRPLSRITMGAILSYADERIRRKRAALREVRKAAKVEGWLEELYRLDSAG